MACSLLDRKCMLKLLQSLYTCTLISTSTCLRRQPNVKVNILTYLPDTFYGYIITLYLYHLKKLINKAHQKHSEYSVITLPSIFRINVQCTHVSKSWNVPFKIIFILVSIAKMWKRNYRQLHQFTLAIWNLNVD